MNKQQSSDSDEQLDLASDRKAIPVIAEELVIDKRPVATGGVRVHKHIDEHVETVDMPLTREEVDVRRVVVNRIVDERPRTREEGDVLIIPVVEEELVVTKRLVLKEELHITKRRSVERFSENVTVRNERAEVTRFDAEGQPVPSSVADTAPVATRRLRRKSILE